MNLVNPAYNVTNGIKTSNIGDSLARPITNLNGKWGGQSNSFY